MFAKRKPPNFYQGQEGTPEHLAWELNFLIKNVRKSMPEVTNFISDAVITEMFTKACEQYDLISQVTKAVHLMMNSYALGAEAIIAKVNTMKNH